MNRDIRIAFVHHGEVLGGATTSLLNTLQGLSAATCVSPRVFCVTESIAAYYREKAGVEGQVIADPCKTLGKVLIGWAFLTNPKTLWRFLVDVLRLPLAIRRQYCLFRDRQYELVHLNSAILFSTAVAVRLAGPPLVWHVREVITGGRLGWRRALVGWFIRRMATKVVCISPAEAAALGGDPRGKVEVVFNFVDLAEFDPARHDRAKERTRLGLEEGDILVTTLGGLTWRKGTAPLVEAMAEVPDNVRLAIVGSGVVGEAPRARSRLLSSVVLSLEDMLVRTGLKRYTLWRYPERVRRACRKVPDGRVFFTGFIEGVAPTLAACDILVAPWVFPHFSRPLFEAWCMEKPVVAADVAGISGNVQDGVDAVLVKPVNGSTLAAAISRLAADPARRAALGKAGSARARVCFRRETNMEKLLGVYDAVLACHLPRRAEQAT